MLYEIKNIVQLHNLAKQRKYVATCVRATNTHIHTSTSNKCLVNTTASCCS